MEEYYSSTLTSALMSTGDVLTYPASPLHLRNDVMVTLEQRIGKLYWGLEVGQPCPVPQP